MELRLIAAREGRLSSFLTGELNMSASLVNKLKWGDAIQVNGQPQRTNYPVRQGDRITVRLDEETPEYPAEDGPLTVLYEDNFLLAVDKPAGMLIHPSRSRNTGTLANLVAGYFQKTGQKSAFHPLTRLDRDTFGVVLLAKNAHVHTLLQNCPVQKTYEALTFGGPAEERGVIDAPIARRPLPSLLRFVDPSGKPARTEFQVLRRWDFGCTLSLRPVTGRTHQLRLHCAHRGFPILGDPQYGTPQSQAFSQTMGLSHQMLWARQFSLPHPITGEPLTIRSRCQWQDFVTLPNNNPTAP